MFELRKKFHITYRLTVMVMSFVLFFGNVVMHVNAANSGSCGDSLTWSLSAGHLTISGTGEMTDYTESNMAPWYTTATEITKITVSEGVTEIGSLAFYGCTNLKSVSLPTTLVTIDARAFMDCVNLTNLSFPVGLETIGEAAFQNCTSLRDIRFPEGLKKIDNYAFFRCYGLTSVNVPASVSYFGSVVFAYCKNLTQATIQCSLQRIPDGTFYGCEKLTSVVLPETASSAGEYAFHECTQLEKIYYSGDSADELLSDIRKDENAIGTGGGIITDDHSGSSTSSEITFENNGEIGKSESTTVTETDNAVITEKVDKDITFQVDGENVTFDKLEQLPEDTDITTDSTTTTIITSTVTNSDGWTEVADKVDEALKNANKDEEKMEVSIRVPDSVIAGSDLAKFAGKDVTLGITTPAGDTWKIPAASIKEKKISDHTYNLSVSITEVKSGKTKIDSDIVFKVEFAENVAFPVTVGLHVGNPYQLATLYEKNFFSYDELHTTVVDADGVAWFTFSEISRKTDYYIGINVAGITSADAVVPETLFEAYGITDDTATLMDAEGNLYEITGNESAWGITTRQFTIYAAIAVASVILLVTLIMVTWNKIQRSKEKYRISESNLTNASDFESDEDLLADIDEEELRMQIMRELLEETKKNE